VGGNSQTGNSRGRESMGIPREFPFLKWRFLGIPRNSHTGEVYWLYRGDFYLQGGIVLFTGRYLLIAPLNILTCDFKTRRERALKAAIRGQYEYYRRVDFSFLYCHTSHTLLMSRWKIYLWTSILRLGESSLELLRQAWIPKTTGNSRESMGIPGNLGNSQGHFTKPGIPLHYWGRMKTCTE